MHFSETTSGFIESLLLLLDIFLNINRSQLNPEILTSCVSHSNNYFNKVT
ncbi:conserved hypothetical protein [Borreliella burgdorferi ZS7]|uniref:Uncharacterized protein n=1 Tax=Borreliella burgdorferi (strain ZS7) TaxID=445985 RepID=A0A0H3C528_BORBZ|nr:conserved hypothetical protein [Borreliella burgdorferi ZS7]